jgi:hypothetical protein
MPVELFSCSDFRASSQIVGMSAWLMQLSQNQLTNCNNQISMETKLYLYSFVFWLQIGTFYYNVDLFDSSKPI